MQRASGDGSTYGFYFDFRDSIFEAGQSSGGTLSSGGLVQDNPAHKLTVTYLYNGNVTVGADTFWGGLFTDAYITITGTANDGTTGETIGPIPGIGFGGTATSTKRYLCDANHPITVTIDITP